MEDNLYNEGILLAVLAASAVITKTIEAMKGLDSNTNKEEGNEEVKWAGSQPGWSPNKPRR